MMYVLYYLKERSLQAIKNVHFAGEAIIKF